MRQALQSAWPRTRATVAETSGARCQLRPPGRSFGLRGGAAAVRRPRRERGLLRRARLVAGRHRALRSRGRVRSCRDPRLRRGARGPRVTAARAHPAPGLRRGAGRHGRHPGAAALDGFDLDERAHRPFGGGRRSRRGPLPRVPALSLLPDRARACAARLPGQLSPRLARLGADALRGDGGRARGRGGPGARAGRDDRLRRVSGELAAGREGSHRSRSLPQLRRVSQRTPPGFGTRRRSATPRRWRCRRS